MNPKTKAAQGGAVKKKKQRSPAAKFVLTVIKILIIFFIAISCAVVGVLGGAVMGFIKTASPITPKQLELNNLTSVVLDDKEQEIAQLKGLENRLMVEHDQIPDNLRHAYVAIEDARFYKHHGVDLITTFKASVNYIVHFGRSEFGGSTITQQLVKNITGESRVSIERKVKECWRAILLEKNVDKDTILDNYMNRIMTGPGIYGVESAAKRYFGKDVWDLSLAECASIAGITKNPSRYSPVSEKGQKENIKRQRIILSEMLKQNYINQQEYDEAISEKLNFVDKSSDDSKVSANQSYFVDQVINDVIKDLMAKYNWSRDAASIEVYNHGLKIYASQDTNVQKAMDSVFEDDSYFPIYNKKIEHPQAAMVIIDPQTGYVKAMYGGYGEKKGDMILNRATQAYRQAGSTFKPIADYAPAIDQRIITAATVEDDVPVYMDNRHPDTMYPKNYVNSKGERVYGGLTTVHDALKKSVNVVAAKVWMQLGPDLSLEYLKRVGISLDKKEDGNLSIALGGLTNGVSPLQMAAAYVPFVHSGMYYGPSTYTKVLDKDGNILLEKKPKPSIAYDETTAYIMTNMMQDVCKPGGTGYVTYKGVVQGQLQKGQMPVAGKTGTTNDDKDRWFMGFTNYYVGAVWFGYDHNYTVKVNDGVNPALKIWHAVMEKAHEGLKPVPITSEPPGLVEKAICIDSGKTPTDLCAKDPRGSRVRTEIFIKGTEPGDDDVCDVHVLAKVCKSSSDISKRHLLFGPYCPLSTMLEQVFIQRKEPYKPAKNGDPYPTDYMYELPAGEYCNVHGPGSAVSTQPATNTDSKNTGNKGSTGSTNNTGTTGSTGNTNNTNIIDSTGSSTDTSNEN